MYLIGTATLGYVQLQLGVEGAFSADRARFETISRAATTATRFKISNRMDYTFTTLPMSLGELDRLSAVCRQPIVQFWDPSGPSLFPAAKREFAGWTNTGSWWTFGSPFTLINSSTAQQTTTPWAETQTVLKAAIDAGELPRNAGGFIVYSSAAPNTTTLRWRTVGDNGALGAISSNQTVSEKVGSLWRCYLPTPAGYGYPMITVPAGVSFIDPNVLPFFPTTSLQKPTDLASQAARGWRNVMVDSWQVVERRAGRARMKMTLKGA